MCGLQKTLTWDGSLQQRKYANFPPLQSHVVIQLPHFPQAIGPTLSHDPSPQPHI